MAGNLVPLRNFSPFRRVLETSFLSPGTTCTEVTTRWRISRVRYIPNQDCALTFPFHFWIVHWNCGKQSLCVWMKRCEVKILA